MRYWGDVHYDEHTGSLRLGEADAITVARSYGTPLLVLNGRVVREACRRYHRAFQAAKVDRYRLLYAGKAFLTLGFCDLLQEEDFGLEVVSGGELYTALAAGFPADRIVFHGNNKTEAELAYALKEEVGRIVVDNASELDRLEELVRERRDLPPARVLLRIVPGVEAHTHEYIETGRQDTKFGFDIAQGQAAAAVRRVLQSPGLDLTGFHCHIGSQIFELEPYRKAVRRVFRFLDGTREATGFLPRELDWGGGLGVRYVPGDQPPSIQDWVENLAGAVREEVRSRSWPTPELWVEPGRSIVGEAGVTLYTVGSIKRLPEVNTYVAVDGGMMENPRPALYGAVYTPLLVTPADAEPAHRRRRERVAIVGRACESGDVLVKEAELPEPRVGDLVALLTTGAYTYSMAGHYNKFPRPAVLLLEGTTAKTLVEREGYYDLIRRERRLHPEKKVAPRPTRVGRAERPPGRSPVTTGE